MPSRKNRLTPHLAEIHSVNHADYRRPRFECRDRKREVDLEVFVPGVNENGIDLEIDARGQRLVVTAHKPAPLVANWQPANLNAVQRDYRLRVRLPRWVRPDRISAELDKGILHIHLPKAGHGAPQDIQVA